MPRIKDRLQQQQNSMPQKIIRSTCNLKTQVSTLLTNTLEGRMTMTILQTV